MDKPPRPSQLRLEENLHSLSKVWRRVLLDLHCLRKAWQTILQDINNLLEAWGRSTQPQQSLTDNPPRPIQPHWGSRKIYTASAKFDGQSSKTYTTSLRLEEDPHSLSKVWRTILQDLYNLIEARGKSTQPQQSLTDNPPRPIQPHWGSRKIHTASAKFDGQSSKTYTTSLRLEEDPHSLSKVWRTILQDLYNLIEARGKSTQPQQSLTDNPPRPIQPHWGSRKIHTASAKFDGQSSKTYTTSLRLEEDPHSLSKVWRTILQDLYNLIEARGKSTQPQQSLTDNPPRPIQPHWGSRKIHTASAKFDGQSSKTYTTSLRLEEDPHSLSKVWRTILQDLYNLIEARGKSTQPQQSLRDSPSRPRLPQQSLRDNTARHNCAARVERQFLKKVHRNQKQLKFAFILVLGNFSHSFRFLHYFLFILTK